MPKPYIKPWPNDKSKGDWYIKVKIGSRWHPVALQLRAPENKREASARAADLQSEIRLGALTSRTLSWLGERSAATISRMIQSSKVAPDGGSPADWASAQAGYMKAHEEKDRIPVLKGKLRSIERTRRTRDWITKNFINWLAARREPFPPRRRMTSIICDYVDDRKTQTSKITDKPISGVTIEGEMVYVCGFAKWLHRKGLCDAIDRDEIREHQPILTGDGLTLPPWERDLEIIGTLHDNRRNFGPPPGYFRGNWSMWLMFLLVRGLGCRPSEAMTLTWDTVDLERGIVRFMLPKEMAKSKNRRRPVSPWRDVPILLEWVREGLIEAKEQFESKKLKERGRPSCPAVAITDRGNYWTEDAYLNRQRRRTFKRLGLPNSYRFKHAQKSFIDQMVHTGFPFHVIAAFTGHSPEVQRQFYCPTSTYLALDGVRDYGRFGVLSDRGRAILDLCYRGLDSSAQYQATVAKGARDPVAGGHTMSHPDMPQDSTKEGFTP
jgi:integrase